MYVCLSYLSIRDLHATLTYGTYGKYVCTVHIALTESKFSLSTYLLTGRYLLTVCILYSTVLCCINILYIHMYCRSEICCRRSDVIGLPDPSPLSHLEQCSVSVSTWYKCSTIQYIS